jgi:HlyD family secretion protein
MPERTILCIVALLLSVSMPAGSSANDQQGVAALGRLEPAGGIVRIAAPSTPLSLAGSVVLALQVREGEDVAAGQLLAVTDAEPALAAAVKEAETELELQVRAAASSRSRADEVCVTADVVEREAGRRASLLERDLASREEVEQSQGEATSRRASCTAARADEQVAAAAIDVASARLALRSAEYDRAFVRAPFAGRVLKINAEAGEYVGMEGLLELGRVANMQAIAEVYETDIRRVSVGQPATVASQALEAPLAGTVAFIRPKVHKQDEIGTDPAARKDARIIEVGIDLEQPAQAASLTNLQVEIVIGK